jgi:hypothetical protein
MLARLREWFERAIRIRHPNVAAVHEMGEAEEELVYLVVECLTGQLLSERLARRHGEAPPQPISNLRVR